MRPQLDGLDGLDGLGGMIVSLYAGEMTVRDIGHHLAGTIGTDLAGREPLASLGRWMRTVRTSRELGRAVIR